MKEYSNAPVSTTSTAVMEAFHALEVKKMVVATPYIDWVNELEKNFFEGNGIRVLNIQGLGCRGLDVSKVTPEAVYRFAKAQDRKEADSIFLSCMGLRTLEVLSILERDLGKPVLSSNQVTLWMLFRLCSIPASDNRCDFGSLFKKES
jgi:maleate cis-trans isomerase